MSIMSEHEMLNRLIKIGVALSATHDLKHLLKLIVSEARSLTSSDGGSLFLKEGDFLRFLVSQTASLDSRRFSTMTIPLFKDKAIEINDESIAGYVAGSKKTEIIDDVYTIAHDKPYHHNTLFDSLATYRTRSMISVPMLDEKQEVIGVLQLVNHMDEYGEVAGFPENVVELAEAVASFAAVAVRNARLLDQLREVQFDTIVRLSNAVEFRDNDTGKHVHRVAEYSRLIAKALGISEEMQELIRVSSPLHDVGKVAIPDAILNKPGKLTEEEFKIMETHAEVGKQIMAGSNSPMLKLGEEISWTHHEKWNGKGYPRGLKGEEIPIVGRIVALADVFDALACKRVYKDAFPMEKVLSIIREDSGTHFCPSVVDAFFSVYPEVMAVRKNLHD